jgi:hypothetical protein
VGAIVGASGLALAVLALTGWAFASGWASANRAGNATKEHAQAESVLIALPDYAGSEGAVVMPDVRGLDLDTAMQVLADAGVPEQIISTTERPAAGDPGVVVQQTPVFGASNPAGVLLVVSIEATVPDVVGQTAGNGVDALQGMGVRVIQQKVYVPGAKPGTITSTEPQAGAHLPETIIFKIADTPVERNLSELTVSGSSISKATDVVVGGVTYKTAFYLSAAKDPRETSWNLGGGAVELTGKLALRNAPEAGDAARVEILADGKVLGTYNVTSLDTTDIALNVSDVTSLVIRVTDTSTPNAYGIGIAFYDFKVLGSYDQMGAVG